MHAPAGRRGYFFMMNRIKDVEPIASPSRIADGDLLAQFVKRRDDSAFAELVARHGRMVFGVCLRRLGQCADAEDAFQVVFLSLAKHAEGLASRTTVGPWLYTVVRQVTTKAIRSRRRRRWLPWTLAPEPQTAEPIEVDVDLDAALATLSESERAAIVLCHLEGLSRSEAAKALGCPEGTLSARLSRGLEKLRKKLGKPPLAVLVAASLVMLPDELPASTVDLVHHFRNGALDDWASPGTLDLFRKADTMRFLHRLGPVVASAMAVGLIAVGASFGWNLIQAKQDKPPEQKSKVEGDRERGRNSDEGVVGPLGGDGSFDQEGVGGSTLSSRGGSGSADAAGRLLGRTGVDEQGVSGGPRGRGGKLGGSKTGSGVGAPTMGGGMEGGLSGGMSSEGGFTRLGMATGMMGGDANVSLADAVKQFNEWAKKKEIGKTQPPLTEDEVVAAIRSWPGKEGPWAGELYNAFQRVADTRTLPRAWRLDGAERSRFNNFDLDVWRIEMSISVGSNVANIVVRDQKIRERPKAKAADAADGENTIKVYLLRNASAETVVKMLQQSIGGKLIDTTVTADARTNSLVVQAPESKHDAIKRMIMAIDELYYPELKRDEFDTIKKIINQSSK